MVHPQVHGRHLVAGRPHGPLPFDHPRQPPAQAVGGGQEGPPVLPCSVELGVERAAVAQLV